MFIRKILVATVLTLALGSAAHANASEPNGKGEDRGASFAATSAAVRCGTGAPDLDGRSYGKLFDRDGVNLRNGTSTSCASSGLGYRGHQVDYHCWNYGQMVNGWDTWTYLRDITIGKYGWVNDSLLDKNAGTRGSLVKCS